MNDLIAFLLPIPFFVLDIYQWMTLAALPSPELVALAGVVAYSHYAVDRLDRFPASHRSKLLFLVAASNLHTLRMMALHPHVLRLVLLSLPVCAFYEVHIPGTRLSVKTAFPCSKTLFVPAMHVANAFGTTALAGWGARRQMGAMFAAYASQSVLMDIKDIASDSKGGVVTVATLMGREGTLRLLVVFDSLCCLSSLFLLLSEGEEWARPVSLAFALSAAFKSTFLAGSATPTPRNSYVPCTSALAAAWALLG